MSLRRVGGLALLVSPADIRRGGVVSSVDLPSWLPDWERAEAEVRASDVSALRSHAQELVDLVLAEDTEFLDALPEDIESAIVTPLSTLSVALEEGTDVELVVASRVVRRTVTPFLAEAPEDLRRLIGHLPAPVQQSTGD
jgi:hypothetical protein